MKSVDKFGQFLVLSFVNNPFFRCHMSDVYTPSVWFWNSGTYRKALEFAWVQMSSDQEGPPGWLGFIGDEILPTYIGIIISNYKDPY